MIADVDHFCKSADVYHAVADLNFLEQQIFGLDASTLKNTILDF
jgi:hypothetical protein